MLEYAAVRWMSLQKRCPIVVVERTPRRICGQPDVLGITSSRYMIEIEIKRTISDFRNNGNKGKIRNRDLYIQWFPRQFYFLVPERLVEKVARELPPWAGLMQQRDYCAFVHTEAPVNKLARKANLKECVHMARLAGYNLFSCMQETLRWRMRFKDGIWMEDDYVI